LQDRLVRASATGLVRVTHALNGDLGCYDLVKDDIGVGKYSDPSKAALAHPASQMRVRCDEFDDGVARLLTFRPPNGE
jgi:hypothetical protein